MSSQPNSYAFKHPHFTNELTIAYLKPVTTKEGQGYAICTSDGEQIAVFDTQDEALFAARQHELEPLLLH